MCSKSIGFTRCGTVRVKRNTLGLSRWITIRHYILSLTRDVLLVQSEFQRQPITCRSLYKGTQFLDMLEQNL